MKSFEIFAANKSIDPLNYKLFIDEINKIMCFVVIWKKKDYRYNPFIFNL